MRGLFIGLLLTISAVGLCQEIEIRGGFLQDSLKIGENVQYWLTAKYPQNIDLILPDSNYTFSPFEFGGREYFETTADSTLATDSVIYYLQSFEIDPVQYLNLKAVVLQGEDSLVIDSPLDSIYLVELVQVANDSTALITNTDYQEVQRQFNSPMLMIISGSLIFIVLVVLIIFGGKIRKYFKLKRMSKAHVSFMKEFGELINALKANGEPAKAEEAITKWKAYIEKLEQMPFTKLTSKEIVNYAFAEELRNPLLQIDRCVYGRIPSDKVYQDFQHLEDFAQNRYDHQLEELKERKK